MSQQQLKDNQLELSYEGRVSDVEELFKTMMESPTKLFEMLRVDAKRCYEKAFTQLLTLELSAYLGRERYDRICKDCAKNYRNGSYARKFTMKGLGTLDIEVPRDRNGKYKSSIIKKYARYEDALAHDLRTLFLAGMSTRSIALFSQKLIGRKVSASEVSTINKELFEAIELWRTRSLKDTSIKFMFVDGVNFKIRTKKRVVRVPMLVVIGVSESNDRFILAIQQGDKDSSTAWRQVFKDLKQRGLDGSKVQLGIMDGLSGLESVFLEEFINAKVQRCTVHVTRNVMAKTTVPLREEVKDHLRDIFYAETKKAAMERYELFIQKYEKQIPSALQSLTRAIDSCLTFYAFPKEEWIALRTTNMIERLNKEFKRRTKPMEILGGEQSAYLILCFVGYKQEVNWKRAPFGKSAYAALTKFTQGT